MRYQTGGIPEYRNVMQVRYLGKLGSVPFLIRLTSVSGVDGNLRDTYQEVTRYF
jgi:hypothetical protein